MAQKNITMYKYVDNKLFLFCVGEGWAFQSTFISTWSSNFMLRSCSRERQAGNHCGACQAFDWNVVSFILLQLLILVACPVGASSSRNQLFPIAASALCPVVATVIATKGVIDIDVKEWIQSDELLKLVTA